MFDFILILAFVIFVSVDAMKTKKFLKLIFLVPVLLSYPMLTTWPSTWTEEVFFIYRTSVILSCFAVALIYIVATRNDKQRKEQEKQNEVSANNKDKSKPPAKNKKKKKK